MREIWEEVNERILEEDKEILEALQEEKNKVFDTLEQWKEEADIASHLLGRF